MKCRGCEIDFTPRTVRQEFHDDACRGAYWRKVYREEKARNGVELVRPMGTPEQREEAKQFLTTFRQNMQSARINRRV
jgi:hypothetical protein